jgi:hypothetical protein
MTSGECFENKWFYMKYKGKYQHKQSHGKIKKIIRKINFCNNHNYLEYYRSCIK